jgi:uncharacterized protein
MSNISIDPEQFWAKFSADLETQYHFPAEYIYKFILPSDAEKLATLKEIFSHKDALFSYRESSSGKYTSITITAMHDSAQEVIDYYLLAVQIEGIKSL